MGLLSRFEAFAAVGLAVPNTLCLPGRCVPNRCASNCSLDCAAPRPKPSPQLGCRGTEASITKCRQYYRGGAGCEWGLRQPGGRPILCETGGGHVCQTGSACGTWAGCTAKAVMTVLACH